LYRRVFYTLHHHGQISKVRKEADKEGEGSIEDRKGLEETVASSSSTSAD
jgi:hypothetical protein